MDPKAFFKLSYGLYIISTEADGKQAGCIANTFNQVTSSPAQVSVTLNKDNATEQRIEKSGKFAVTVLQQSADMELIGIPHTIVLGDRNLDNDDIEYKYRRNGEKQLIKTGDIVDYLVKQIKG